MAAKGTTKAADAKEDTSVRKSAADATARESAGVSAASTPPDVKADAVAAAHEAVAQAESRKKTRLDAAAEAADTQFANAAKSVAADEAEKAAADDGRNGPIGLPDVDPKTPLSKDEQAALANARSAITRVSDPNDPPITAAAQERIDAAEELPPATQGPTIATPGASATNPALMRNDVDVQKTPPFGSGARPSLQG